MFSKPHSVNLMNHPYYLTLIKFIDISGFKIARYSVRNSLKKVKDAFDLSKFHELLTIFFSDLLIIQVDSQIDNHKYIITPCFLLRTEGNRFFIYVILEIGEERVSIFEYDKKEYTVSTDEFQNLLKGSILIFKEEETYNPSKKILKEYNEEQEEDATYIKNIKVIDDFISEEECTKIIAFCEENNLFERSKVGDSSNSKVSDDRTSSSAMIESHQKTPIIFDLKEKIAVFLKCNINKIEELQGVRYYKSEEFRPHFDASVAVKRKTTCLLYLNEGFLGGETYFPEVGFNVTPKTGRLLIFQNMNENNNIITQSFHQGYPILNGVKYACNIWIKN